MIIFEYIGLPVDCTQYLVYNLVDTLFQINLKIKCKHHTFMNLNFSKRFLNLAKCMQNSYVRLLSTQGNLIANMLGISNTDAQVFVKTHKLENLDTQRLAETLKFIKTRNIDVKQALNYPKLFSSFGGRRLEQTYMFLIECGCTNISITDLINIRRIRALTIEKLKELKFIPKDVNVAEKLITYLNPLPDNFDVSDLQDDLPLGKLHSKIVVRYLKYRLEASDEDIEMITRVHHLVFNKSLTYLCENINLALDLGYTKKKILRNAYVMCVLPKVTKEVLETLPHFAETDMGAQLFRYPKLIGISVQQILTIYEILKNENISDEVIKRSMNIFTLSPKTIKLRLDDIKSTPETRVLMHNPRMLALIIHYHSAKNRLQFLQKIKLRCASLIVIGVQGEYFENHIKEGKDVNKASEIDRFLRILVKVDEKVELDYKKHPYYLYVPFVDIEDTYYFLKQRRFTNEHLLKAIHILLYPKVKIAQVLEKIHSDQSVKNRPKKVTRLQMLNLALYMLEKDHHFSGNGIWRHNEIS